MKRLTRHCISQFLLYPSKWVFVPYCFIQLSERPAETH